MIDSKSVRRNFALGVFNGLFFILGETLIDPTLVIAAFVSRLTDSALWVGLVMPLLDGAWFLPQLWVSGYLQSQPHKMNLYRQTAVARSIAWTLLTVSVFTIRDSNWLLAAFFATLGVAAIGAGLSGLSFLEIVGKTIPAHERGWFFAWRLTLGGVTGIAASVGVQWALGGNSPLRYPFNFGVLFLVATLLFLIGLYLFTRIHEPPDTLTHPRASAIEQLRRAARIVRADSNYRHFLSLRSALMIAGSATPFFAIYVQQKLGGSLAMIGVYLGVLKTASLLTNMIFGRVSARWGNHRLMTLAAAAGMLMTGMMLALAVTASLIPISGTAASLWLIPVFAAAGIRESGIGVSGQSLLLDIAPPSERSLYLGFTNTLLGVILLSTGLGGVIVETLGFLSLLMITLAAHLFALGAALRLRGIVHRP
ncbi:MAG: MFS transporter [Chloroflexi bacterium]|nr:MFS transporter [Chloroflexota bacterium]